jgi:adenosylcobinamide-GDP ribazoletransferase
MKIFNNFLLMLQFFTRIPVNRNLPCGKENFRRGTVYFPLIGFIVGGLQWIVYFVLVQRLPGSVTAVLTVLTGVLVTGALHMDGLGDTCDGFFAFKGRERIMEIMKDSRIGTYACIAIVSDLLLKVTAIAALQNLRYSTVIIAAPVIGRTVFVLLFHIGKNAKANGTGNLFIGNAGIKEVIFAALLGAGMVSLLLPALTAALLMVTAIVFAILFNSFCEAKIGGLTGDTLGACNEIIEIMVLVVFIAVI